MLKIKLARFGKKQQPHYRIVVNEARDKRDGKAVDVLGQYAPTMTPKILNIEMDKLQDWIKKGAQPTDTVAALIKRFQSGTPFPAKKAKLSRKAKAKAAAEVQAKKDADEAAKAEAAKPAEPVAEAATTETPAPEVASAEEAKTETPAA